MDAELTLAQALHRNLFAAQDKKRLHGNCFVACAWHDFWCQVAIAALHDYLTRLHHGGHAITYNVKL